MLRAQDGVGACGPCVSLVPIGYRPDKYDDHWRYDPRFTGSFDDDPEPRRDLYGEEADRRSVHSEHSAQSLRSRRSSFSSHSQQVGSCCGLGSGQDRAADVQELISPLCVSKSQVYRSHNVSTGSFHGDYAYSVYAGTFPEWPAVEQGVWALSVLKRFLLAWQGRGVVGLILLGLIPAVPFPGLGLSRGARLPA